MTTSADGDVRAPLEVELRGRLQPAAAAVPRDGIVVAALCEPAGLTLSLAAPGVTSPPTRRVVLGTLRADARPRAVALTIAELIRAQR